MSASADPVVPGSVVTYTITATNQGASNSGVFHIYAVIPPHTTTTTANAPGISNSTCTNSTSCLPGQTFDWYVYNGNAGLAPGASTAVQYSVVVDATSPPPNGTIITAQATGPNGNATQNVTVTGAPVMELGLVDAPNLVNAGGTLAYILNYGNVSASAINATLSLPIPTGTSFASATNGATAVNGEVKWNLGTLPAGASGHQQLNVLVAPGTVAGTQITAAAALLDSSTQQSYARASRVSTVSAPGTQVALSMSASADPVVPGSVVTYTITATNQGASNSGVFHIYAVIPPHTTTTTANAPGISNSTCTNSTSCLPGQTFDWYVYNGNAGLAPGASTAVQYSVVVDATSPPPNGTIITAQATGPNGNATQNVTVTGAPVMELGLVDAPNLVNAGGTLAYILNYGNVSASAINATLSLPIPTGTSFASATNGATAVNGEVKWNLGTLPAGASGHQQLNVLVAPGTVAGTQITAAAALLDSSTQQSYARASRVSTVSAPGTQVALSMSASADPVVPGSVVTYTITATNQGASNSGVFHIYAVIPPHTTTTTANAPGISNSTCTNSTSCLPGQTFDWYVYNGNAGLAPGASTAVQYSVVVDATSPPPNGTIITAQATGPNGNATQNVTVTGAPVMELGLVDAPNLVNAGGTLAYILNYGNVSASAINATLSLPIPTGTSFASATNGATAVNGEVKWNLGTLPAGASGHQQLNVLVAPGTVAGTQITAAAALLDSSTQQSYARASRVSTVSAPGTQVALSMSASADPVVPGSVVTYTITATNQGASNSGVFHIYAVIPPHTTTTTANAPGISNSTCTNSTSCLPGQTFDWYVYNGNAGLAPGASTAVQYSVVVDATSPPPNGTIITAQATGPNGNATQNVTVTGAPKLGLSGIVTNAVTRQAIAGATVWLGGAVTTTDAVGYYHFAALANASYALSVTHTGYANYSGGNVNPAITPTRNIALTANPASCPPQTLTLNGLIVDALTGVTKNGVTVSLNGVGNTTTSGSGVYQFNGIANGIYTVSVVVSGYAAYNQKLYLCGNQIWTIGLTRSSTVNGMNSQAPYSADPVNTATGNYTFSHTDLKLPGKGSGFSFERNYNSQDGAAGTSGPLGYGWTHNLNSGYSVDGGGNVTLRLGDGKTVTFAPDGNGGYTPQYGVFDTLTTNAGGYLLTRKDKSQHSFNSSGRLASITDRNGNTQTLTWAGSLLTQVTDTAGRTIAFTYDGNGRIIQITDPLGRTVQFAYDGLGDLVSSTDPSGNVTQYSYDTNHQLLTATDPRGNVFVSNTYDVEKRVVTAQKDAKGGQTSFAYDQANNQTALTDPLGNVTVHHFDTSLRMTGDDDALGHSRQFAYDASGNRTQVTDRNGNLTLYAYDTAGNVIQKTDALGYTTAITYDANHNPLTRTDALGNVTSFTYDAFGNLLTTTDPLGGVTQLTYNDAGQPLTLTNALGNVTTHAYNNQGNLVSVLDAQGGDTQYGYDGVGRRLARTDALGRTTNTFYDPNDNVVLVKNPAGVDEAHGYDGNNNRTTVTDRLGRITTTAYDQKDLPTTVTNALAGITTTAYDALDRRISVTNPRGFVTQFGYDAAGRQISQTNALGQVTQFAYDAEGNRTGITDALGHVSTSLYDPLNRPYQTTDPVGNVTTTGYDALGRNVLTVNAKGQATSRYYDALGRLIQVNDAAGGQVGYQYDAVGNRTMMTDPRGNITSYVYDTLNRLVVKIDPGGVTQYVYDAVGNRTQVIRPDNKVIHYSYDILDRLTTIAYPDGGTVQFSYDAVGKRTTMTDRIGTTSYTYDALDRLTGMVNPHGKTIGYQYDPAGNLIGLTYPDGKQVSYVYDALNRLIGLTDWASRSHAYSYDAAGRLLATTYPNGTSTAYGYDVADRQISLYHRLGTAAPFASYTQTLDALGNPLQVTGTEPLSPLFTAGTLGYAYDADNRQVIAGSSTQNFDAKGNLIASGPASFVWDDDDRLKQSSFGISTQSYQYDGVGNRMSRTVNGAQTRYVLDTSGPLSKVLAETTAAGAITAYYVYGLGLVERVAADSSVRYYHQDSRGSIVALTSSTGAITDRYAYDPFGRIANSQGSTANPFKFVGQYGLMDEGNGLTYIRARYYQPERGRFLSKDPMPGSDTDTQSLHRYIYAMNNPIRLVDVSGLSPQEALGGAGVSSWGQASSDLQHSYLFRTAGAAFPSGRVLTLAKGFSVALGKGAIKNSLSRKSLDLYSQYVATNNPSLFWQSDALKGVGASWTLADIFYGAYAEASSNGANLDYSYEEALGRTSLAIGVKSGLTALGVTAGAAAAATIGGGALATTAAIAIPVAIGYGGYQLYKANEDQIFEAMQSWF